MSTSVQVEKTEEITQSTENGKNQNVEENNCTLSAADLDKKIIRQIEYYLSDVNMVRDKFLKNEITKDDGWIPLSVLITFKRLQSLTTDFEMIIGALKKSQSGLIEIDENDKKIRRDPKRPVPSSQAELDLALRTRTVFVKGFPKSDAVNIDKLLVFFEKFGSIESIQMKKQFKSKDFSGAVFVVFSTEEKAKDFIDQSKENPIKYEDGSALECSLQDDHYKKKALEAANGGDTDREKRANDKQSKKEKRKDDLEKKTNEHLEKLNNENLAGALIHLGDLAPETTRELIKEKLTPFTKMPWVDFNKGDPEAWVRLNEANTAKDVLEKVLAAGDGKLVINNKEVTCRVVEGEEEDKFWKEANEKRAASRTQKNERFAGGKRGKRNRRGGGQKRKFNKGANDDDGSDDDGDQSSAKKVKANDDED